MMLYSSFNEPQEYADYVCRMGFSSVDSKCVFYHVEKMPILIVKTWKNAILFISHNFNVTCLHFPPLCL